MKPLLQDISHQDSDPFSAVFGNERGEKDPLLELDDQALLHAARKSLRQLNFAYGKSDKEMRVSGEVLTSRCGPLLEATTDVLRVLSRRRGRTWTREMYSPGTQERFTDKDIYFGKMKGALPRFNIAFLDCIIATLRWGKPLDNIRGPYSWELVFQPYLSYQDEQTIEKSEIIDVTAPEDYLEWEVNNFMSNPDIIQSVQDIAYGHLVKRMSLRLDTFAAMPLKIQNDEA